MSAHPAADARPCRAAPRRQSRLATNATAAVAAMLFAACDSLAPAESPPAVSYPQNVTYNTNVYSAGTQARPPLAPAPASMEPASQIEILPASKSKRPAQIVGVVDVHGPMASEEAARQRLREKAAALGADAVLGVEFHHSEETGPTHLSGLAVRYTDH